MAMPVRPIAVFDIECYRNYFLVMFQDIVTGKYAVCEKFAGKDLDVARILRLVEKYTLVSFNGDHYDIPMLSLALTGASNSELKDASDAIVQRNLMPWDFADEFGGRKIPNLDHIDLKPVAPGMASLKIYGGRIHAKRMQDLPIEPHHLIEPEQRPLLVRYCGNDLETTAGLYYALLPVIELRARMSVEYGVDLRSKGDAKIAETVIVQTVRARLGRAFKQPKIKAGTKIKYKAPPMIAFRSPAMRELVATIEAATFRVNMKGSVEMPKSLKDLQIQYGTSTFSLGIGGLHSIEKSVAHFEDEHHILVDRDVASYYPWLILLLGSYPEQMGPIFLEVLREIVLARLAAKAAGIAFTAGMLKIVINSCFGKFGSKWSKLYAPALLIMITLTGQLALLMLVEALEDSGISVVSGNTDGTVIRCPKHLVDRMEAIVAVWEMSTGLTTEATYYSAIYSANVNNYIAVKTPDRDGKVEAKLKGWFAPAGLSKNPTSEICSEAVVAHILDGAPIAKTIHDCRDIKKFVTVRKVDGGAEKYPTTGMADDWVSAGERTWVRQAHLDQVARGDREEDDLPMVKDRVSRPRPVEVPAGEPEFLGKSLRWYYPKGEQTAIFTKKTQNLVPKSEGARPLMELPDEFPDDVDHSWYIDESLSILKDIGATQ